MRGELRDADADYREAATWGRRPDPGRALLRLAEGDPAAAAASIRRAVDEADAVERVRLLDPFVEIMLAAGDLAAARQGMGQLRELTGRLRQTPLLEAVAARAEGSVLLAEGDPAAALAALRRSSDRWRTLDAPYEEARLRVTIAEACRALGDHDTAALELAAAREVFDRLGAVPDRDRVDALAGARSPRPAASVRVRSRCSAMSLAAVRIARSPRSSASASGRSTDTSATSTRSSSDLARCRDRVRVRAPPHLSAVPIAALARLGTTADALGRRGRLGSIAATGGSLVASEPPAVARRTFPMPTPVSESIDTLIIGAGQAGLSAGYHLAQRGLPFAILDADTRIGDHWRDRWDSLKLYSPARYDSLPGMKFPAPAAHWPTAREMGDYLEAYARRFDLPVRSGTRVERIQPVDGRFLVATADGSRIAARQVVIATGAFREPYVRRSRQDSTRRSCRCTPTSTAIRHSCAMARSSWSGCPTPAPTSPSKRPTPATRRSCPADSGQMPIRVTDTKRAMLGWPLVEFVFGHVLDAPDADGPADATASPQVGRATPAGPPRRPRPGRGRTA